MHWEDVMLLDTRLQKDYWCDLEDHGVACHLVQLIGEGGRYLRSHATFKVTG